MAGCDVDSGEMVLRFTFFLGGDTRRVLVYKYAGNESNTYLYK